MEFEPLAHVSLAGQARLAFLEQQFGGSLAWCLSNFITSLFKHVGVSKSMRLRCNRYVVSVWTRD